MSEPFLGEIKIFAGTFAPRGWSFCDGQLLAISANSALFSLLGTIYGGDGRTTFALPDLRGRVPMGWGNGPGLTNRPIGNRGGSETAVVSGVGQLPSHNHNGTLQAVNLPANTVNPEGNQFAVSTVAAYHSGSVRGATPVLMNAAALENTGGGQAHGNVAESLAINFIIALVGIYPSRS